MTAPGLHATELRVGVLYDGSESSSRAVDEALVMLRPHSAAHLVVLTVVEKPSEEPPFGFLPEEAVELVVKRTAVAQALHAALRPRLIAAQLSCQFDLEIEKGEARDYVFLCLLAP